MEPVSHVIKSSIPKYLAGLPVPDSFLGFFRLSFGEWLSLTPLGLIVAGTGYLSYRAVYGCGAKAEPGSRPPETKKPKVNESVNKENPKIVDTVDIEEIGDQKVFCRCWRSKMFPYCDGSHNKHNAETGDNVGPLIIKK